MKWIIGYIFLSLICSALHAQVDTTDIVKFDKKALGITRKIELNADSLVNRLTAGKTSDKEKFDAIFAWVASEISYDWWDYYSAGSPAKMISNILESKRAICVGYATLMDTLCTKAGIQNVMVGGYAKDDLFDVHDSLNFGNHAWNAVKLDGKWYVYDVTWSTGKTVVELTKFSRWVDKKRRNFKFAYKKKRIISKRKLKKLLQVSVCGKKPEIELYRLKWRFWSRVKYTWLHKFKLKTKRKFRVGVKTDFYLCQPEVFAKTHFPNDPVWSLCEMKTMKQFENDSAWYYLHDSIYKVQQREGSDCAACDTWVGLTVKNKHETLKSQSFKLNSRDKFTLAECDWAISDVFTDEARLAAVDSVKLMQYDSALAHMKAASDNYQLATFFVSKEARKQKLKNRKKLDLLLIENAGHMRAFNSRMNITLLDRRSSRSIVNKSRVSTSGWRKRRAKIAATANNLVVVPPKNDVSRRIDQLKEQFDKETEVADSLRNLIKEQEEVFDLLLTNVALNIPRQALRVDSMEYWFYIRAWERTRLLDNYKKPIVDTTSKLFSFENRYFGEVDEILYKPFDSLYKIFLGILDRMKKKNAALDKSLKLKIQLVKLTAIDLSDLAAYKKKLREEGMEDICWLNNDYGKILMTNEGFDVLMKRQQMTRIWINRERWVERRYRHRPVEMEWQRRYNKYNGIAKHNKRLTQKRISQLKKERRPVEKREKIRKSKK